MSTKYGALNYAKLCIEFIHFQHPVLTLSQSTFFPYSEKPSFKPINKAKISLVKRQFLVTYNWSDCANRHPVKMLYAQKTHTHIHSYIHAYIHNT